MGLLHIGSIRTSPSNDEVFVIADDTADSATATTQIRYILPTGLTQIGAMTLDSDGNLHVTDNSGDEVFVIPPNTSNGATATTLRRYNLPSNLTSPFAMTTDDDGNIHVADQGGGNGEVYVISANTANNATATTIRRYNLPSALNYPNSMTRDASGNLHIADNAGDEVFVIADNTANNATATTLRRYNLPTGLTTPEGMARDSDNNLHVVDRDREVYVIADNTANNARAAVIRRYNISSDVVSPRAMTFVPVPANFTISTDDFEIVKDEAVDINITSDVNVPDLVASNITVVGGTRGALTETDARNWVLRVTAGSAGTMTISIAADVIASGNAAASEDFTVYATAQPLTIQQFGVQNIPIGTEDYELPILVTGNPDEVGAIGDWEDFSGHWDRAARTFYIRADDVSILKDGASWALEAVKGEQSLMRTVQYNVISSLPVILDPGRLYFFRGVENNKFIGVSNAPNDVNARGDLIGMSHGPGVTEDGDEGIEIKGTPDETVVVRDDLNVTLSAENPAGNVSLPKPFELLDTPTLYVMAKNNTPRVARIFRTHKDTENDTAGATYSFPLNLPEEGSYNADSFADIKRLGDFIYALVTSSSGNLILKYAKDTVENITGEILETLTLPSGISNPTAFLPLTGNSFNVVDQSTRRIHTVRPNSTDPTQLDLWISGLLPSAYADVSGLYRVTGGDAYVLDRVDRKIGVITGGNLAAQNLTFGREFSLPSSIVRPVSLYVDDTYCYLCDFFAIGATANAQIVRVAKNTANGQTATIERSFGLGSNLIFPSGIFIDE